MTRDEYLHMLATEPATVTQVGAIHSEFARLGVHDRTERLAISAALLDLEELGSTTDLVMGDAGRLVRMLLDIRHRAELPDVTAAADDEDQADEGDEDQAGQVETERVTWPEAITRILVMIYTEWKSGADKSAEVQQQEAVVVVADPEPEPVAEETAPPVVGPSEEKPAKKRGNPWW